MGANTFATFVGGNSAAEAFNLAREWAIAEWEEEWEEEYDGYSGTVAEKTEFKFVTREVLSPDAALRLAMELIDEPPPWLDKWGPAGCVAVENNSYLFFGWASS